MWWFQSQNNIRDCISYSWNTSVKWLSFQDITIPGEVGRFFPKIRMFLLEKIPEYCVQVSPPMLEINWVGLKIKDLPPLWWVASYSGFLCRRLPPSKIKICSGSWVVANFHFFPLDFLGLSMLAVVALVRQSWGHLKTLWIEVWENIQSHSWSWDICSSRVICT